MISQLSDNPRPRADLYECFMCGEKFDSELDKDYHMGTCMMADGPNSLDSSLDDPVRALFRRSGNHPMFGFTSHQLTQNNSHSRQNDFSAPVGSTRLDVAIPPYIPQDYSQAAEVEMFRRIQYPPKPKPTPAGRDQVSSNAHQIAPYVQEGPRNQLFQNSNIQSGLFHPRVSQYTISAPLPQTTAPFGYSRSSQMQYAPRAPPPPPPGEIGQLPFQQNHLPITRHASDSRFRDIDIRSPPSYVMDTTAATNALIQPKQVPRTDLRESHQPEVELIHHEVPYTRSQPRDSTRGDKFEVKLLWQKQQPTLERNLEYLDIKDTEPIILKWEYRKELFIASAKLSAGEHKGSLAIPDSDAVVYEVQPFNVSKFSVSVQEIKLELLEIAPQYKNKSDPAKRPVYSQIDLASKHLANSRRGEQHPYLPERRATLSATENSVIPPARQEERFRVEVNVLSPAVEHSAPQSTERPNMPPKYGEEIPKYQSEISPQTVKPFKIVREERKATISGSGEPHPVFKSTLPRHEERLSAVLKSPPQDHPLPPPRNKPSVTTEKSREELEQKRQIDALIAKLKTELANVKTEREETQMKLGEEVRTWKNNHENLYQLKVTVDRENDSLKKEVAQIKTELTSAIQDKSAENDKWEDKVRELEDKNSALLREKGEVGRNREDSRSRLHQAGKRDIELEGRFQNLLEESQKKIHNLQTERDSYKTAAYKYRAEREKVKQALEEQKLIQETLKAEYEQKTADALYQINTLRNTLKQSEEQNHKIVQENNKLKGEQARNRFTSIRSNNNNNNLDHNVKSEVIMSERDVDEFQLTSSLHNFNPVRSYNESGYLSLGAIDNEIKIEPEKKQLNYNDRYLDNKPIPAKKPSLTSVVMPHDPQVYYAPSYPVPTSEPVPPVLRNLKKKSSVHDRVKELEGNHIEQPVAPPRYSRDISSGRNEGLLTYQPELLNSFVRKHTPVFYKSNSVNTTKLSYLQRPESHLFKQVLVKIKDVYRLGTLQIVFSKKISFSNRTRIIAGIKLEEPAGNSNGMFDSIRYFDSEHNHAIFISVEEVFIHLM